MLATMKTGTKILAGFGIAIMIALVVGGVGYDKINTISRHVTDIGEVHLPCINALNMIAKGQLNVSYGERGLMAFTFFFRDTETLERLIEHALPAIRGQSRIRIWDAGCAHGPESYTLAILLREKMSSFLFRNVTIHASDIDQSFATKVLHGVHPEGELQRIPTDLFSRYFRSAKEPGYFQFVDEIRGRVELFLHDLLSLTPIREGFSLIVCKNVLLHFDEQQRCDVLRMFHRAMREDGLLAMEHTQKMPESLSPMFEQVAPHAQVYKKLDIPTALNLCGDHGAVRRVDIPVRRSAPLRRYNSEMASTK